MIKQTDSSFFDAYYGLIFQEEPTSEFEEM